MRRMPYATGEIACAFRGVDRRANRLPDYDAGMRQLLAEGWMHNRVRMIVASFSRQRSAPRKWTRGARHFMRHLVDAELASNQHAGRTAGTGTDAAPYFRVFNPISLARSSTRTEANVRCYAPERLRGSSGAVAHEPWNAPPVCQPTTSSESSTMLRERTRSLANYRKLRAANRMDMLATRV